MIDHKQIQANSLHRFSLDRFCIAAEVVGARHTFCYFEKQVSVELPREEGPPLDGDLWCYAWRTEGNVPINYQVRTIKLRVAVGDEIVVPEEALKISPRRDELFTESERKRLDKLIDDFSALAVDAFRYWLSVLRWKSGVGHIGEPQVKYADHSSGGAALQDSATGHRFWLQPHVIAAQGSKVITLSEWQSAQQALSDSKNPPIWFEFVFEGEQRINNRDLIGAALSLAIGLEAIVRTLATHHLSTQSVEPLIYEIVDRANLRSILTRLRCLSFWNKDWERIVDFSEFNVLMNYRDRIMHSADTKDLTEQRLRKLLAKVKALAYFASAFLGKE
jgi:hypothetical protein